MIFKFNQNTLSYEVKGAGHPVIVLHAMGTDHRAMTKWLEPIFQKKEGFQRYYIDLPWHGHSECKDIVSTEEIRQLLFAFIKEKIGEQFYSVIGHSFGGYIAQGLLSGEKVTGLCLVAPAIHVKERAIPSKNVYKLDRLDLTELDSDIRAAFETLMVYQSNETLRLFMEEVQPGRLLADRSFLSSNWREAGYFFQEDPLIKPFYGPSLLIAGRQDPICGYKDYYEFAENLPNATLAVLRAGHLLPMEKRETVQFLVSEWLDLLV